MARVGDWDSLFRRDAHHERSQLFRDTDRPRIYLTADYWKSRKSYEELLQAPVPNTRNSIRSQEKLTANERHIGSYEIEPA